MQSGEIDAVLQTLIERAPALRAAGVQHVQLPGGLSFTLRAAAAIPAPAAAAPLPPEDEDPIAAEQREERELRAKWQAEWTRMTRSSGGNIPPFPSKLSDARRAMATLFGARAS